MTRFLTAVVATFFMLTAVAHAARVQIYDYSVNDILNDIKRTIEYAKNYKEYANVDFTIRGTHYYTGKDGFRYCESHFGDSDKNRLIFRVNNNGAVSSAWIVVRAYTLAGEFDENSAKNAGLSIGVICGVIGMSTDELSKLVNELKAWVNTHCKEDLQRLDEAKEALNRNDFRLYEQKMNERKLNSAKTFSVWCAKARRYIDIEASLKNTSSDDSTLQLYIYAHN